MVIFIFKELSNGRRVMMWLITQTGGQDSQTMPKEMRIVSWSPCRILRTIPQQLLVGLIINVTKKLGVNSPFTLFAWTKYHLWLAYSVFVWWKVKNSLITFDFSFSVASKEDTYIHCNLCSFATMRCLLFPIIGFAALTSASSVCPDGWWKAGDICYIVSQSRMPWYSAQEVLFHSFSYFQFKHAFVI